MRVNLPCKNYKAAYIYHPRPVEYLLDAPLLRRRLNLRPLDRLGRPQTTEVGRNPSRDSDWNKRLFTLHVGLVCGGCRERGGLSRSVVSRL